MYMYMHAHVHVHLHVHVQVRVSVHVYVYVYTYVCVLGHVYVYDTGVVEAGKEDLRHSQSQTTPARLAADFDEHGRVVPNVVCA